MSVDVEQPATLDASQRGGIPTDASPFTMSAEKMQAVEEVMAREREEEVTQMSDVLIHPARSSSPSPVRARASPSPSPFTSARPLTADEHELLDQKMERIRVDEQQAQKQGDKHTGSMACQLQHMVACAVLPARCHVLSSLLVLACVCGV